MRTLELHDASRSIVRCGSMGRWSSGIGSERGMSGSGSGGEGCTAGFRRFGVNDTVVGGSTADTRRSAGGYDNRVGVTVFPRLEAEGRVIDVAKAENEVVEEDGPKDEVKHAVEHSLGGRGDDVAAFGEGPGDGIQHEDEGDETGTTNVAGAYTGSCIECRARAVAKKDGPKTRSVGQLEMMRMRDIPDVEHGKDSENVKSPFVRRTNKSADETGYDNHPREERGAQDIGQRQSR